MLRNVLSIKGRYFQPSKIKKKDYGKAFLIVLVASKEVLALMELTGVTKVSFHQDLQERVIMEDLKKWMNNFKTNI